MQKSDHAMATKHIKVNQTLHSTIIHLFDAIFVYSLYRGRTEVQILPIWLRIHHQDGEHAAIYCNDFVQNRVAANSNCISGLAGRLTFASS